jgi:demethylmenaquinone methyltransferase/2-methoxy-6-polyprenyl-1,4-benzoquinol methylase
MEVLKDAGRIRRMFAAISPRYDFLNHFLSANIDRTWRRRLTRELELPAGANVLDVCTGTADLALELARTPGVEAGGLVVGSDFTPEMLAVARRKLAAGPGLPIRLCLADTLRLPFADASFDAVTVAFGLRNLCDLAAGLAEMRRVLRPGGSVAVLDFSTPRRAWFRAAYGVYFHRILPRLGAWISGSRRGGEAYSYLPASVSGFPSPEALAELFAAAGFTAVRWRPLSLGIATLHLARRPAAVLEPARASR